MTTPPRRTGNRPGASVWLALTLALLVLVPCISRAARGSASVAASLTDATVDAGEQAQFRISVTNGDADDPPRAPVVEGLTITYAGKTSSSQFTYNNGSFTQNATTTYVYAVETNKPGRFTIPGQEVRVDGAILRTLPVTLTVLGGGDAGTASQNGSAYVELIVPKKSAYVGESIPIEVRACYASNVRRNVDPDPILSGDGFSVQKFTTPRVATVGAQGGHYNVDIYKSAVAGLKIGTVSIGPVSIEPVVQLPRSQGNRRRSSYNDPFDSLFGDPYDAYNMAPPRQVKLESQTVTLEVKPLPEAGKPAAFSGAIGQFKLEAEAVPTKAQTGDPVTIRLRLSGQGNFDRINPPVLSDDRGLRTYPPTSKFKPDDEVNLSGVKTFEQVVIAEGPRTSLPAYHFNYLDPATGRYVTVDTPPLPVRIEGGNLATPTPAPAASMTAPGSASPTPPPAPTPRRAPEDIHYILAEPGPLRDDAAFLPMYRRPFFWEVQGGILTGVLALGGLAGWRTRTRDAANQRAAQLARQQADLQRALRREDTGRREFYTAATRLAQLRVGAAAGQPDGSLSAADIVRVKGLDPQTAGSVREIFDRHEELAYSGGAAAETPVPSEERRGVLATLETISRY